MKKETAVMFELIRCGATGEEIALPVLGLDWDEIFNLAQMHKVVALVYKAIRSNSELDCPKQILQQMKNLSLSISIQQICKYRELSRLLQEFKNEGLHVLLFKGIVLAALYSDYLTRSCGDADLLVNKNELKQVQQVLERCGYEFEVSKSAEHVMVYISPKLNIDLHTCLWNKTHGRYVDVIEKMNILGFENSVPFREYNLDTITFAPEEGFIYLLVHMAKHIIHRGIGIRSFMDISLYYNNYKDQINVHNLWNILDDMGFTILFRHVFSFCTEHLGMERSVFIETENLSDPEVLDRLIQDVMDGGVFGRIPERLYSSDVVTQAYYWDLPNNNKFSVLIHLLFPKANVLREKYSYAQKNVMLLPVAWAHRICNFVKKYIINSKQKGLLYGVEAAQKRIHMLEGLGLIP